MIQMTVKERMIAIRLLEKANHNPEYMKDIGVSIKNKKDTPQQNKTNKH